MFSQLASFLRLILTGGVVTLDEVPPFQPMTPEEQAFYPHYQQKLLPLLRVFEQQRLRALRWTRGLTWGVVSAYSLIGYVYFYTSLLPDKGPGFFGSIAVPLAVISCMVIALPGKFYIGNMKRKIYPLVLEFFGPDFSYATCSPHPLHSFAASGILPDYTHELVKDYVSGSYKGVPFAIYNAELTREIQEGKNRRTVPVFEGLFIQLGIYKKFSNYTIVKRNRTGLLNWRDPQGQRFERVKLEDPKFEEEFDVYSTSQIESRYLLTTSFMDRLLTVADGHNGGDIQCSFYDQHLLLSMPCKQWLAGSSLFTPATFDLDIRVILRDIHGIFNMLDELQLDQKTGL